MAVQWSENLAVGVNMIDEQHKGIFSRINNLMNAMSQGKGKEEVGKVLEFLADYTQKHFSAEEKLMMQNIYGGYPVQKAAHTQFIKDISGLKKDFDAKGATSDVLLRTQRHLSDWLMKHIVSEDKKLGTFLQT